METIENSPVKFNFNYNSRKGIKCDSIGASIFTLKRYGLFKRQYPPTTMETFLFFILDMLDRKRPPWASLWFQPLPIDYETKEHFRGINFLTLRANNSSLCPYWLAESYITENNIQPKEREKGTPVLSRKEKNGAIRLEYYFNLEQLKDVSIPECKRPAKPGYEIIEPIIDFFYPIKKHDDFTFKEDDFVNQDYYIYHVFQYLCYNWYCQEYGRDIPFKPELCNKDTLVFRIGAALLAAYCRISTPYFSILAYELNSWKMLLIGEPGSLLQAVSKAMKMYDSVMDSISLEKAS